MAVLNFLTLDSLPLGFGFHPTDVELISHYLKSKILGQNMDVEVIPEIDIYKHEPWDLPAKSPIPSKDCKWHFFNARDRKYPNGSRSNRATVAGYWKSTGKDRNIKIRNRAIGTKKTLVFHKGRPPCGERTDWIMHEYHLNESECKGAPGMKDAFVICRITKKNGMGSEYDDDLPSNFADENSHLPLVSTNCQMQLAEEDPPSPPKVLDPTMETVKEEPPSPPKVLNPSQSAVVDPAWPEVSNPSHPEVVDDYEAWCNELYYADIDKTSLTGNSNIKFQAPVVDNMPAPKQDMGGYVSELNHQLDIYASSNELPFLPAYTTYLEIPGGVEFSPFMAEEHSVNSYLFDNEYNMDDVFTAADLQSPTHAYNTTNDTGIQIRQRHPIPTDEEQNKRIRLQVHKSSSSVTVNQTVKFVNRDHCLRCQDNVSEPLQVKSKSEPSVLDHKVTSSHRQRKSASPDQVQKKASHRRCSSAVLVMTCVMGAAALACGFVMKNAWSYRFI
ncbi:NAC domain-containing protein 74 [Acorus calamus]|uniref:NAC domain-containing protein 74 n=1 Tax=Acorus calamus TaxID=4465 RepID=A0AAV9FLG0_ACOCL|nr:NAC domain-containing protein 74 [Acorus calamus]